MHSGHENAKLTEGAHAMTCRAALTTWPIATPERHRRETPGLKDSLATLGIEDYRTRQVFPRKHIVLEMHTLLLIAQKGGTGKTTFAINLSATAGVTTGL